MKTSVTYDIVSATKKEELMKHTETYHTNNAMLLQRSEKLQNNFVTSGSSGVILHQAGIISRESGVTYRRGCVISHRGGVTSRRSCVISRGGGVTYRRGSVIYRKGGVTYRRSSVIYRGSLKILIYSKKISKNYTTTFLN